MRPFRLTVPQYPTHGLTLRQVSQGRDDTVHRANLEDLRQILGRSDFIYVADGKLASSANLREIARHPGAGS